MKNSDEAFFKNFPDIFHSAVATHMYYKAAVHENETYLQSKGVTYNDEVAAAYEGLIKELTEKQKLLLKTNEDRFF